MKYRYEITAGFINIINEQNNGGIVIPSIVFSVDGVIDRDKIRDFIKILEDQTKSNRMVLISKKINTQC